MDSQCKFYRTHFEDLSHALFYCLEIKEWYPFFLTFMNEASANLKFLELFLWVKSKGTAANFENLFFNSLETMGR